MFIRRTRTNNAALKESYFTYRLVRGERIGGKVRQITVLNLGRNFSIKQEDWPLLCSRIEHLLHSQDSLFSPDCSEYIERAAQRYVGQLIARAPKQRDATVSSGIMPSSTLSESSPVDYQEVDIYSLQLTQPRSVGVEHIGLHALTQLGLIEKLAELGINGVMRAAIIGNIIGRMAYPASELSTWQQWLQTHSALGELIDVDFAGMSPMSLYRASDALMRHRDAIEDHLFGAIQSLFDVERTVTLYDLTNTYFEGGAAANPKAQYGRSKEKRSDCPLVTLGMVLDGSGFVRRSRTFAGNASESATLAEMLTGLNAPPVRWSSWMRGLQQRPIWFGWSNRGTVIWWCGAGVPGNLMTPGRSPSRLRGARPFGYKRKSVKMARKFGCIAILSSARQRNPR